MRFGKKSAIAIVLLLAGGMAYYYFGLFLPRSRAVTTSRGMAGRYQYGGDFYPIWLTGRELLRARSNPYSDAMTQRIQIGLYGRGLESARRSTDPPPHYRAFSYPLYTDLLAIPLLFLSFVTVRVLLTAVLPLLTAVSIVFWARAMRVKLSGMETAAILILALLSYPVLEALYAQQPALWVGFWLAGAMMAVAANRLAAGGALMALTFIKPQVTAPLAAWLLLWCSADWKHRKAFALSLGLTTAMLLGGSELALPGWYRDWYHAIVDYRSYTLPPLAQFVLGRWIGYAAEIAITAVTMWVLYRAIRKPAGSSDFNLAVSILLAATILLLPTGGAVYDHVVLLGGILWLYGERRLISELPRPVVAMAILLVGVVVWQWVGATVISIASLANLRWAESTNALLLPVRTAASLPFVLYVILIYVAVRNLRHHHPTTQSATAA